MAKKVKEKMGKGYTRYNSDNLTEDQKELLRDMSAISDGP